MIKYSTLLLTALLAFTGCGGGGGSDDTSSTSSSNATNNNASVVINEVLADNNTTLADPDLGLYSDWIELKNISSTSVDLSGYGLSDSEKKIKWRFPNGVTLDPNALLLVWADDFNQTAHPNPQALHTNFKLKSNDDKVVLYNPQGEKIAVINLKDYKVTSPDISIARTQTGEYVLSSPPTPNQENNSNAVMVSKAPKFEPGEGVYTQNPLQVTLTAQNGATICYTTDGSHPTADGSQTTICNQAPLSLTLTANKTTLKAIAIEPGENKLKSKEKSKTYVITPEHDVVINEIFADNNTSQSDPYLKSDWVELYNISNNDIDLSGYRLSDSKKLQNSQWQFPAGTILNANSYLVIFADDQNTTTPPFHTDFKLSNKGDSVVLYNANGEIIDFKDFDKLKKASLVRVGDNNFTKTSTPTPGAANLIQ